MRRSGACRDDKPGRLAVATWPAIHPPRLGEEIDNLETTAVLGRDATTEVLRKPGAKVSNLDAHSSFIQSFDGDVETRAGVQDGIGRQFRDHKSHVGKGAEPQQLYTSIDEMTGSPD